MALMRDFMEEAFTSRLIASWLNYSDRLAGYS
jgi:hypothetical protein